MTLAIGLLASLAALSVDRSAVVAANQQAQAAQASGDYEVAEARLRYALRVWAQLPDRADADEAVLHGNLAALYLEIHEYTQALRECERAMAIRPSAELRNGLAIALQGVGRLAEAEAAYSVALAEMRPGTYEYARTEFNRATVLAQLGQPAAALSMMEATLPLLEADPKSHVTALWQAAGLARPDRARRWLEQAQELLDRHAIRSVFLRRVVLEARAERAEGKRQARQLRNQAAKLRTPPRAGVSVEQLKRERY